MDVYPDTLPAPTSLQFVRRERRSVSDLPGPPVARARSRELILDASAEWIYSASQMAVWVEFYEETLSLGLKHFAASLPGPDGWQERIVRYRTETVRRLHIAHGIYRIQAALEVSARSTYWG